MSTTRTLARVGTGLAAAGVGAALGLAAERLAAGRQLSRDDHRSADGLMPYGSLRGRPRRVLATDGTRLHAEVDEVDAGDDPADSAAPTLVFTHGFALNLDSWHFQRAALRGHYRLVFWDQRGHGRSAPGPRGFSTIETIAGDLARVVDELCPTGPVVLVGHSMGGMTVMAYAGSHPEAMGERVIGAALIGTSAGGLAEIPLLGSQLVSRVAHRLAPGALSTLARRPTLVSRTRRLGSDLEQILVRRYSFASPVPPALVRFAAEMIAATPVDVVADYLPTFDVHDQRAALPAFEGVETLVLNGADDVMIPADHADELARLMPAAEHVVVADAGHLVMLEHPEVVDQALFGLVERAIEQADARARRGRGGRRRTDGRRRTVVGLGAPGRRARRQGSA